MGKTENTGEREVLALSGVASPLKGHCTVDGVLIRGAQSPKSSAISTSIVTGL